MKNKTKNLTSLILGVILIIGFVALLSADWGGNKKNNNIAYSAGAINADKESFFDFGTISMKNGNVSHEFELSNNSEEAVKIEKVYTSCMCTSASILDSAGKKYGEFNMPGHAGPGTTNIDIKPGETVTLEATFDPNAHGPSGVGLADRSIYLETNSSKSPKVELKFRALVTK